MGTYIWPTLSDSYRATIDIRGCKYSKIIIVRNNKLTHASHPVGNPYGTRRHIGPIYYSYNNGIS